MSSVRELNRVVSFWNTQPRPLIDSTRWILHPQQLQGTPLSICGQRGLYNAFPKAASCWHARYEGGVFVSMFIFLKYTLLPRDIGEMENESISHVAKGIGRGVDEECYHWDVPGCLLRASPKIASCLHCFPQQMPKTEWASSNWDVWSARRRRGGSHGSQEKPDSEIPPTPIVQRLNVFLSLSFKDKPVSDLLEKHEEHYSQEVAWDKGAPCHCF